MNGKTSFGDSYRKLTEDSRENFASYLKSPEWLFLLLFSQKMADLSKTMLSLYKILKIPTISEKSLYFENLDKYILWPAYII